MIEIVRLALEEDIGSGRYHHRSLRPRGPPARGRFLAREPLIVAGLEVLEEVYATVVGPLSRTASPPVSDQRPVRAATVTEPVTRPSASATATPAPTATSSPRSPAPPACCSRASASRSISCNA